MTFQTFIMRKKQRCFFLRKMKHICLPRRSLMDFNQTSLIQLELLKKKILSENPKPYTAKNSERFIPNPHYKKKGPFQTNPFYEKKKKEWEPTQLAKILL